MTRDALTTFDELSDVIDDARFCDAALDAVAARIERTRGLPDELHASLAHQVAWRRRRAQARRTGSNLSVGATTLDKTTRSSLALGGKTGSIREDGEPIAQAANGAPATFLFRMDASGGWIFPAGLLDGRFRRPAPTSGSFATGGIVALDDDRCVATFAHSSTGVRPTAEALLHRWALDDDWDLTILDGTAPLPPFAPKDWSTIGCNVCLREQHHAAIAMPYIVTIAYKRTRCWTCGRGRRLPLPE